MVMTLEHPLEHVILVFTLETQHCLYGADRYMGQTGTDLPLPPEPNDVDFKDFDKFARKIKENQQAVFIYIYGTKTWSRKGGKEGGRK